MFGAWLQRIGQKEYFPLILVGGFTDACIELPDVTDDQSGRSGGDGFFGTCGEGVTPRSHTIITGYGLNGLLFEIQRKTRFPINFNWVISLAWVRTLHEQNFGRRKRSGFFSRNSKLRLPQTDAISQGWVFGAWLQRIGEKKYFPLILVGGFTDACIAT